MKKKPRTLLFFICALSSAVVFTQEEPKKPTADAAELAKKLANPVASLISVPLQNSIDVGIGDYNGTKNTLNIQPVIPITLTPTLNLIERILPLISQHDITGENTKQSGLSDAVVSAFISPAEAKNGMVWGAGPVLLVPTATNDFSGTKKFGVSIIGPGIHVAAPSGGKADFGARTTLIFVFPK